MIDNLAASSRVPTHQKWIAALALMMVAGFGLRVTFVVVETKEPDTNLYDALYYKLSAVTLSEGNWFQNPYRGTTQYGSPGGPAAEHPPMTTVFLAPVGWIWGPSDLAMGLAMATLGTVNIGLIGMLGRRLRSVRTGIIAGAIAAVYPFLWVNDGLVMSETPTVTVLVLCLLATYRLLDRWRLRDATMLGLLCGLAALTRGEFLLLAPLIFIGALLARGGPPRKRRAGFVAVGALASVIIVAPWVTYNLARFREPVLVSTNLDLALWATSCDETFYGSTIGLAALCPGFETTPGDQSQAHTKLRERAFDYIGDHIDRYPLVVLARAGRTWSLFRPFDMVQYNTYEGRPRWVTQTGLALYYPLLILAVWGFVLSRRRIPRWPLLIPPVVVTMTALVSLGEPRYRVPAEPVIVILAALAIDEIVRRRTTPGPARVDPPADSIPVAR